MPTRLSSVAIRAESKRRPGPAVLGPEIRDGKPPYGGQGRGEAGHGDLRLFCVAAAWRRRRKRCCVRRFGLIVESRLGITTRHRAGLVGSGSRERCDSLGRSRHSSARGRQWGDASSRDHVVERRLSAGGRTRDRRPGRRCALLWIANARSPLAVFFCQCFVLWSQGRTLPFDSVVSEEAVPLGCSLPDNSFMCSMRLFGRMSVQC